MKLHVLFVAGVQDFKDISLQLVAGSKLSHTRSDRLV